jgi:hypothetical protein
VGLGEVELGVDVEAKWPRQRERPLEQPGRGALVASVERALPRSCESIPRAERERGVGPAQLGLVAGGLLEVVAHHLVQLDEGSLLLDPGAEPLVQLGADRLRKSVVRCVADQQVAEPEPVVARQLGGVWANQLTADERG